MDDGGLSQKKRDGKVHANELMLNTGLDKQKNQIIIDYFKDVWGINFNQYKNKSVYRLACGTKEARKFIQIVKPYVEQVDCMKYKLNVKPAISAHRAGTHIELCGNGEHSKNGNRIQSEDIV